jgi:hypothetical protein
MTEDRTGNDWLLVLVPAGAWLLIEILRELEGRPTRSAIAEELLLRSVAIRVPT